MLKAIPSGGVTVFRTGRQPVCDLAGYYAHCFLIGTTLIDTSTSYVGDELVQALNNTGVSTIINTHHHEDHTGNNAAIQQAYRTDILAHSLALPLMREEATDRQRLYLKLLWNRPVPTAGMPLPDLYQKDGYELEVIHTPGHTPDHVCLYERNHRFLFTGDMYCGIRVKYLRRDEDFNIQLESMRRIAELDVDTIFCAVNGAVPNGRDVLRQKLAFMEELHNETTHLRQNGLSSVEIRKRLLGSEGLMYYASAGHFAKQNLIDSILL